MYVAVLFDYIPFSDLYNWYIHMADSCIRHGFPLITKEHYLNQDFRERFNPAFYSDAPGIGDFLTESLESLEQYAVPDAFFHDYEKEMGSYTAMQTKLMSERSNGLERYIEGFLEKALSNRLEEKLEGIFSMGDTFESLRHIAQKYNCPVIAIELSAIRAITGQYTQSLYYANIQGRLYCGEECRIRYENFLSENGNTPMLSRRELIALFCSKESLLLIPLLDAQPEYEIAAFGTTLVRAFSSLLLGGPVTDDDLQHMCNELFSPKELIWRERPFSSMQFGNLFQQPNPLPTILRSKRVAAVVSNSLMEAMLWNRTACTPWNFISFAFVCEKDLKSEKIVDISLLNYILFGYLVPGFSNIFNTDYWAWRKSGPSETEIYVKHLAICLKAVGLDASILKLPEEERFLTIMRARGCDDDFIAQTMQEVFDSKINYDALISSLDIYTSEEDYTTMFCRNSCEDGVITSRFKIPAAGASNKLRFFSMKEEGFVRFESIEAEGADIIESNAKISPPDGLYNFYPHVGLRLGPATSGHVMLTIKWRHKLLDYDSILDLFRNNESLIHTISLCDSIQDNLNRAITQRDMLMADRDTAIIQRDALVGQRDALMADRDTAIIQRDALMTDRDTAVTQRDAIINEYNAVLDELAAAIETITSYQKTIPCKLAQHFKRFTAAINRKTWR